MLTSQYVTGTSLLDSTGAVSCYPATMVKNMVLWWQIFEVLQLQPQKTCKAIAFTCLWGQLDFDMFEQNSALAHRVCKMVAFLDRETPDFMSTCCSVLTQ